MNNDDENQQGGAPAQAAKDGSPDFNSQPWHVLIGIRPASDPANPSDMRGGLLIQMAGAAESMDAQGRPDKTNEAVHFAQWFDRNKEHLVALWRIEYVQYMNLRQLTSRPKPGEPQIQIVAANGERLQ